MPVSSLCKALIYDQKDLGLSFRLAATISDMSFHIVTILSCIFIIAYCIFSNNIS